MDDFYAVIPASTFLQQPSLAEQFTMLVSLTNCQPPKLVKLKFYEIPTFQPFDSSYSGYGSPMPEPEPEPAPRLNRHLCLNIRTDSRNYFQNVYFNCLFLTLDFSDVS